MLDQCNPHKADLAADADHSERVSGINYISFLGNLHLALKPSTYLEIGTHTGASLGLARCASMAVDPQFRLSGDIVGTKPACFLFQETSDSFFKEKTPTHFLGDPVELAFLDGMHLLEFTLRDFVYVEKHCRRNSIIAIHDCLPPGFLMTERDASCLRCVNDRFAGWWTGDVWKLVPILKKFRPDLSITLLDCPPTGLVLVTNLDPSNQELSNQYQSIISEFSRSTVDREEYDRYWSSVELSSSRGMMSYEKTSRPLFGSDLIHSEHLKAEGILRRLF